MNERHPLFAEGWTPDVERRFGAALGDDPSLQPGRVTRVERIHAFVQLADGEVVATVGTGEQLPVVGDWVAVRTAMAEPATTQVAATADRSTTLVRRDPDTGQRQALAANVDIVAITAPADRLNLARVERELLIAYDSGARPLVVITKADTTSDVEAIEDQVCRRLIGTDVVVTSATTGQGVDAVHSYLRPNLTAVFLGPSGAGKSSLANALIGTDLLRIGEVREGDRRGRHTTTTRQLAVLPGGGVIIDTPGIRSIGVVGDEESLGAVFADVVALAETCRFSDCRHDREPDCAVQDAIDRGELDPERLASWVELRAEAADANRTYRTR